MPGYRLGFARTNDSEQTQTSITMEFESIRAIYRGASIVVVVVDEPFVVDEPLVMVEVVEFCHPLPLVVTERDAVTMFPA